MGDRTIDEVLFSKFVDISERQASALAMLADRQRNDDEVLRGIAGAQQSTVRLVERVAERLDHMEEEAAARSAAIITEMRSAVAIESGKVILATTSSDKWVKIACALLGFVAAILSVVVVKGAGR